MSNQHSFPREKINILLLEGVHPAAVELLHSQGYRSVTTMKKALVGAELSAALANVHFLGIRSRTQLTAEALEGASNLVGVGCFCIGTNQVDLDAASRRGIAVFNAPFSNTRSVAELTMAEVVMLARRAALKSQQLHQGVWDKSAAGCYEVRHKTIGIIGYGHIGPQVGLLAEAFGMRVIYFDIAVKLALGNARSVSTIDELLRESDFVTLHVPETPQTRNMISERELGLMKRGSFLLNLSRGSVVDVEALASALQSGRIAGAALDVFPSEPESNDDPFLSPLRGVPNVILTPHIGGSTEEAQHNIALEVTSALLRYSDTGSSSGSVNFPQVDLPLLEDAHRILNVHRNVPGVLRDINNIIADVGGNIRSQFLATNNEIGYLIIDVDRSISADAKRRIEALETNIRTRVLF